MSKVTEWESTINEKEYKFAYQKTRKGQEIEVNGEKHLLKTGMKSHLLGFDEPFEFDGISARLILSGDKPDVAVNGICIRDGETYTSNPTWAIVFAVLCGAIPIVTMGGAIPAVIGIAGAGLCIFVAKLKLPTILRVLFCTGITVVAWIVTFMIVFAFASL